MGKKISKEQRDRFLKAWDEATYGRFSDKVTPNEYQRMSDELGAAARPLGIAFMYPGLVAEGL